MRYIRFFSAAAAAAAIVTGLTGLTGGPASAAEPDRIACSGTALAIAVNTAQNGDTLELRRDCTYHLTTPYPGSDNDGLPAIGKNLTIRGNGATIVRDGLNTAPFRIFDVNSGGNLRLENLTVRGGYLDSSIGEDGAGIRVNGGGALSLVKVDVLDNTTTENGGGVAVEANASATVKNSYVAFNNANNGGGLYTAGAVTIENSEFARNHARTSGGGIYQAGGTTFVGASVIRRNTSAGTTRGGGIYIAGGTVEICETKIANNTDTGNRGGGIYNNGNLRLVRSEVSGNVVGGANGLGGGIYNTSLGVLTLKGSEVFRNSANGPGTSVGGGIYNAGGSVTLDHSTVRNNASTAAPGGVFTSNAVLVTDSKVVHNIPTNCTPSPGLVPGCTD
ncbi:right-handed parallel beta-helix repeat-containing protein [Streptomyces sp. Ag109_O5-1]|uniref:right-handed parallel beta-helix repeat-containing protein n=1 Tax=Streptomyces sp. Ag109_O5-1 TaxID=1938851 RepID=UPI000F4EB4E1|nr:right-handed parallel beta-helix repeat-containing protein [Streptomyces sp. Ag109_O5-1]